MPNNITVTPENVCQHVAVMRTNLESYGKKIDSVDFKVDKILDSWDITVRRANKHHEVFYADQLKIAKIDPIERDLNELKKHHPINDNGEERREGRFKHMPWWQKLSVVIGAVAILFRPEIQDIVSFIVKSYLGIE